MATITVKNIPDELYEKLRKTAKENRRSINSEIIMCIERAIQSNRVDTDTFLHRLKKLQDEITVPFLTEGFLQQAKREGRL